MAQEITTEAQYRETMAQIEGLLQKATAGGGFASLTPSEADELERLSGQVAAYEADMPLFTPPAD